MSKDTSWENVHEWYDRSVGKEGHYYHQNVIIPRMLTLLDNVKSLLDVGCGQGIFARKVDKKVSYTGIDISPGLIAKAKSLTPWRRDNFIVQNAEKPFPNKEKTFSHAVVILALQNMENPKIVLKNIHQALEENGKLIIVLNHPCFRIPRMSGWHIDPKKKLQSRRIDSYMSSIEIPIHAHPSEGEQSSQSISFHHPLSYYSKVLHEIGFAIDLLEEWCSDKTSTGKVAKMENRARKEFPLFLAIVAKKI